MYSGFSSDSTKDLGIWIKDLRMVWSHRICRQKVGLGCYRFTNNRFGSELFKYYEKIISLTLFHMGGGGGGGVSVFLQIVRLNSVKDAGEPQNLVSLPQT